MPSKRIHPEQPVEYLSILDENGTSDSELDPDLDHDALMRIYKAMVLARALDERMITMQRQGEMGTFAPGRGQEATQIGQVFPLEQKDWFAPSYRSFGAQLWRGWSINQLLMLWDGYFEGFKPPEGVNDLPFSIVIGSHVPVAVGVAMAINYRDSDAVMVTNFGEGASSEGDVSESLNFAAVFKAPIVFVCENNGYAISLPFGQQAAVQSLAHRAPAFGMPGWQVDGNDVLAMIVATQRAVDRARHGEGPSLIEAVTYRMEMHTTADDPKIYRSDDEVESWKKKDPIARFEKYMMDRGALDQDLAAEIAADTKAELLEARARFHKHAKANPYEVFDFVYTNLPKDLAAQRKEYLNKLDGVLGQTVDQSIGG